MENSSETRAEVQAGSQGAARPLADIIDQLWALCQSALGNKVDLSAMPRQLGRLTIDCASGKAKLSALRVVKTVDISQLDKGDQVQISEILKLFDGSSNAYRSITNVLLEYGKLHREMAAGTYDLHVGEYSSLDGVPIQSPTKIQNKALCPVCRSFQQSHTALALITGNPKMDSLYQTYRNGHSVRTSMKVCAYCFTAGWVDLPTALVTKDGQSVSKGREYLFITTPLSRQDVQQLLDAISRHEFKPEPDGDEQTVEPIADSENRLDPGKTDEEEPPDDETPEEDFNLAVLNQLLRDKYGVEGFDRLAVLGMSTKRLRELRGFVLPSANPLLQVIALRVPVERLVGEDNISGAVRRELMKATMYDFWQITCGSLHYNRVVSGVPFSVDGRSMELEEMRRANLAYSIANRYARGGRKFQLNSGLFMLLLSHSRRAANAILRAKRRKAHGQYAPRADKIKEVIGMVEELAIPNDWKFNVGLRIVELLITMGLTERATSFWYRDKATGSFKLYSGVDLVKWLQRIKMVHDPDSARSWGTALINAYRREHNGEGPNTQMIAQVLALVEYMIQTCNTENYPLKDFARDVADMDYYLLFYYNQRGLAQTQAKETTE